MSKNSANHLHRYKKVNLSRDKDKKYLVYKCVKPLCSHYLPIHLAEGKECECNICYNIMVITKETLTHSGGTPAARPRCDNCVRKRIKEEVTAIAEFLKE
jgi:hypothetical protein